MSSRELNTTMDEIADAFRKGVTIADRKYRLTTYKDCFVGTEAVDFMVRTGMAESREDAVQIGQTLSSDFFLFEHVTRDHPFVDDYKFFRFLNETERGAPSIDKTTGKTIRWGDFLDPVRISKSADHQNPAEPKTDIDADLTKISPKDIHVAQQIWPLDTHNQMLLNNVHPPGWVDPIPKTNEFYDLVVIGGGTAGLVTAAGSAGVGARVAMIEAHLLGGDWYVVGGLHIYRSYATNLLT